LTLLISRAEIVKQNQPTAPEVTKWRDTLFPEFFNCFQTRFAALFPPSHIIPPIVTSSRSTIPQAIPVDDTYVWQFLASVAVSGTSDHQRVLVTEVRYVL
jgi:DNA topoisomerase 2-associated protein PAT1